MADAIERLIERFNNAGRPARGMRAPILIDMDDEASHAIWEAFELWDCIKDVEFGIIKKFVEILYWDNFIEPYLNWLAQPQTDGYFPRAPSTGRLLTSRDTFCSILASVIKGQSVEAFTATDIASAEADDDDDIIACVRTLSECFFEPHQYAVWNAYIPPESLCNPLATIWACLGFHIAVATLNLPSLIRKLYHAHAAGIISRGGGAVQSVQQRRRPELNLDAITLPVLVLAHHDYCPVCMENANLGAETCTWARLKNCNHLFHKNCLLMWYNGAPCINAAEKCPLCRSAFIK